MGKKSKSISKPSLQTSETKEHAENTVNLKKQRKKIEMQDNHMNQSEITTNHTSTQSKNRVGSVWKTNEVLPPIQIPGRPLPGQEAANYSLGDVISSNRSAFIRLAYFSAMLFILPVVVFFVVQTAYDDVIESHLPAVLSASFTAVFVQVIYVVFAFMFPEP